MKFSIYQLSRQGGRAKNEDRMGYSYTRDAVLLALADGMGGHPEGEMAAQLAIQAVSAVFQRQARPRLDDVPDFLSKALLAAHQDIVQYASSQGMLDNPRTTLVAAVVQEGRLIGIHSGDSRLYVVRDGQVLQRSRDHSYMEKSVQAKTGEPVNRNILFTCLGSPMLPLFDVSEPLALREGDRVLLCSDGLWGVLEDEEIAQRLSDGPLPDSIPALVDRALQQGGRHGDNVTVIAIDWETSGEFEPTHVVYTDSISDGVFASTIQAGAEGQLEDFDDEAIERSIAEINEAIRRTAARKGKPQ